MEQQENKTIQYQSLIKRADKLYQEEEIEDALELYLQAYDLKPNSIELLNKLGQSFCCVENFEEAIKYFNEAISIRSNSVESYFNLGVTYDLIEQFENAIEAYSKASELNPKDADILFNIGADYDFLGKTDEALEYYKKALTIHSKMQEAAHNIGVIYLQRFTNALLNNAPESDQRELIEMAFSYFKNKADFFQIINNFVTPQIDDNKELTAICKSLINKLSK